MNALRRLTQLFHLLSEETTPEARFARIALPFAAASAFATIVLAFITGWYAISTARMVGVMERDFDVSNRPYIYVGQAEAKVQDDVLNVICDLNNSGKIPAVVEITYKVTRPETGDAFKPSTKVTQLTMLPGQRLILKVATIPREEWHQPYDVSITVRYKSPSQDSSDYETLVLLRYTGEPGADIQVRGMDMR